MELKIQPKDSAFAGAMLVCGFLLFNLILYADMPGAGVTVFALVLIAVTWIYLAKSGYRQNGRSLVALTLTVLASLQFLIFAEVFIGFLTFVLTAMLFVYWVMVTTGRSIQEGLSATFVGDVVQQGFIVPFCNFGTAVVALARRFKESNYSGILLAGLGILLFFPLLAAVVSLLISADLAFETFLTGAFESLRIEKIMPYVWQFILGIPVALYLFGLIFGNSTGRFTRSITIESLQRGTQAIRIAPRVMIYSALSAFCLIYTLFFIVQGAYLFSGFLERLPEAYTYAEYARRGFFELCAVAGINLVVLAIASLLIRRDLDEEPRELRIATSAIALFTVLLIATALSKMALYINTYGLTVLRVYTSWFMVLLLLIFVTILIRQFIRFNAARIIIVGFVVLFFILAFGNVDGVVASHNIALYETALAHGEQERIDIDALAELSDGAVEPMYAWYQRLSEDKENEAYVRRRLEEAIMSHYRDDIEKSEDGSADRRDFRAFNLQRERATRIREKLLADGVIPPPYRYLD